MNRIRLPLVFLMVLFLAACERQQESATIPAEVKSAPADAVADSGLVAVYRIPELSELQTGEVMAAACASEVTNLMEWLGVLEEFAGIPTVENYLEPYNAVIVSATNMAFTAGSLAGVSPDEGVRKAADDCSQSLTSVFSDYSLSRPLYERISQVELATADAGTQRFVEKQLRAFHLSGVDKDDATRARIKTLNEEITVVGQEFDNNIRDSVSYLELDSVDQLAGLPQDYIDAHPPGDDGKIRISTQYPDLFPFMNYAKSDELRFQLTLLRNNLAHPQNQAVLERLLALRFELARLLGFENYAQWVTADKMAGSPQRVESFIEEIKGYTTETQNREYAMLLTRLQQDKPEATRVESWQAGYLEELVKAEEFNVDSKQVREYFSYNNTRDGIFMLVQDLFNVQIKPWQTYTWDESVEAYELWDGDQLIGNFFLDMHPRANKYQHAAQFPLRNGISGVQTPLAALVCNFPSGDGLMEHGDVETFLHEFGHLMHTMFSGGHHWADIAGINTEWDFVEAPSQMLEEWVWDYGTLSQFAKNAAGESIPKAMLDRMIAARDFGLGLGTRRQLALAALSMGLYNQDPQGLDIKAFTDQISRQFTLFEPLQDGHFYSAFGHLNGYSAIYYTYQWSLAIAADMFTRFKQEGLRNVETAGEYRDRVLGQGGAKPAAQLLKDFLGRDFSIKPYAERLQAAGQPAATAQ